MENLDTIVKTASKNLVKIKKIYYESLNQTIHLIPWKRIFLPHLILVINLLMNLLTMLKNNISKTCFPLSQIGLPLWPKWLNTTFFGNFLAKKHCFGNKQQSTTFSRARVSETRVPHQFYHRDTAKLEFVRLKKIMWYSSLVNSSTMQHSTRIPGSSTFYKKKQKKNNAKNTKTI